MNKKVLALALVSAMTAGITSVGAMYQLDPVRVTADREGVVTAAPGGLVNQSAKVGVLGNRDIMEIPYSEMSMSKKTLETFTDAAQPLCITLANNPSIRASTTSPMYTDFSMRGINMNGNHIMLNGIPSLFYQFNGPVAHVIERMDITSGPNAGVNGVSMSNNGTNGGATPAPGTINVVTKRAGEKPITNFTQTYSSKRNFGEFIDIARRVGDGAWGVRVMGEYLNGEIASKHAKKRESNLYVNLDNKTDTSATNIFAGIFDLRVDKGQRWFTYGGTGEVLPKAPLSDMDYDFEGTSKWMHGYVMTFNHEHKLDGTWDWFVNAGVNHRSGDKYNSSAALKFDEKGNFTPDNVSNAQMESGDNKYIQAGIRGKIQSGEVEHNVSISVDRAWAKYWNKTKNSNKGNIIGGLYDGTKYKDTFYIPKLEQSTLAWSEVNTGVTIADAMKWDKMNVLVAFSHKHEDFDNVAGKTKWVNNDWLPTFGITYRVSDEMALYAGQTRSISRGTVVKSNAKKTYVNDSELLSPSVSKQFEIGMKYKTDAMLHTFSYFYIDQQGRFDQTVDKEKKLYRMIPDGREKFKGVEWTVNGQLTPKLTVTGGLMYIDAKRDKTADGKRDGLFVNGVSNFSGVIGLIYAVNEDMNLVGRVNWTNVAYIDNDKSPTGKTEIPAYSTVDVGMNFKTAFGDTPVFLNFMCYNLFNNDYWMGRGSSTTFGLSMPRSFMLSARFEF